MQRKRKISTKSKTKPKTKAVSKDKHRKGYVAPSEQSAKLIRKKNSEIAGRPSQYPAVSKKLVYRLYLLGLSDDEVSGFLDVSRDTIVAWKKQYPEFLSTIRQAKEDADSKVVRALYRRALGSKLKATKFFQRRDGTLIKQEYIEHYPPDVQAIIFWLKNRHPKLFSDRPKDDEDNSTKPMEINVNVITSQDKLAKLENEDGDQEPASE